jgi:hypothetical protein
VSSWITAILSGYWAAEFSRKLWISMGYQGLLDPLAR